MDQLQNHNGPLLNSLLKKHFNPYWEIFEIVLLENSSNYFFEISILGRYTGRFTGKLIHQKSWVPIQFFF